MWIDYMKDSKLKVLDFKTAKQPIKVLGVNLSHNRRSHGRRRHLGSGANAAKFTVNVWEKS